MNIELIDRLWKNTEVINGHWLWKGPRLFTRDEYTYGYITIKRVNKLIHRLSISIYHGLNYTGKWESCHTCEYQHCWNPLHLYIGTAKSNARDRYKDKTHCIRGHPWIPENTYTNSQGTTGCRICRNEYNKKNWRKYYYDTRS